MSHEDDECPICLEKGNEKWKVNGCTHLFCRECIQTWAANTNKCPLCKSDFSEIERSGARTLSAISSRATKKRVTRSQVDKSATIAVQGRILEPPPLDEDELRRLGLSEEEVAYNLREREKTPYSDDEDKYDCDDGFCVKDSDYEDEGSSSSIEIISNDDIDIVILRVRKKRKIQSKKK